MIAFRRPVQSILSSGVTNELDGVLSGAGAIVNLLGILGLSVRRRSAGLDDGEFVSANPARENLVLAGVGVKEPLAFGVPLERNGEGKIVRADEQHLRVTRHLAPAVHDLVARYKRAYRSLILDGIARENQFLRIRPKYSQERILIARLGYLLQLGSRRVGRSEHHDRRRCDRRWFSGGLLGLATGGKGNDQAEKHPPSNHGGFAGYESHFEILTHRRPRPVLAAPRALACEDCHPPPPLLNADDLPPLCCCPQPLAAVLALELPFF